jgi:uncharacterized membrane protein YgdD (TMEM256/DUF423 family)
MIAMFALGIVLFSGGIVLITNPNGTHVADIVGAAACISGVFFISTGIAYWLGW